MPIYEYECAACGQRAEQLQKINDPPLTACPKCGEIALSKCVSLTSFQLKGAGWYKTDFKNKPAPDSKHTKNQTKPTDTTPKNSTEVCKDKVCDHCKTSKSTKEDKS